MTTAEHAGRSTPPIMVSVALLLALGWLSRTVHTDDMNAFLLPWFAHIIDHGPVAAFSTPFSNYNPPYLYLLAAASPLAAWIHPVFAIKLVSYAGHASLGVAIYRLLIALQVPRASRGAAVALVAPTLFANPAILVQCDAFWTAALVMALAAAIERRSAAMMLWCGVAIAFKLQAGFVGPFFLAVAVAYRVPVRLWLLAPAAYAALLFPAWAAGWPARDLLAIYVHQSGAMHGSVLNAPNVWTLVDHILVPSYVAVRATAFLATLVAVAVYLRHFTPRLREADAAMMLRAALICSLIVPGLLPQMHERYFFVADVLAIVMALYRPGEWRLVLLTQLGSGLAILAYLSGAEILAVEGALAMLGATWLAIRPLLPWPTSTAEAPVMEFCPTINGVPTGQRP